MVATPLTRRKIIKKRLTKFTRFESDCYPHKLRESWRKPRGIDNRVRRRYRGNKPMPIIGYGSNRKTRNTLPNGFKKFLITSPKDLELLLTNNRVFCGELASNLSSRTRAQIVKRAAELNVRLTNGKAKLRAEEKK
jgi:large subunit ribosomal protein L32e